MEKTLRVLSGDEESGAGHSHSHSHSVIEPGATASGVDASKSQNGLRSRTSKSDSIEKDTPSIEHQTEVPQSTNGPSKLSAYLNLFGDFVHNM